ncbi:hypothetical protein [Phytohabitans suffuscus]|uniref:Uncharacterized protein n=1 Tax=Phytohabitans suffuscus TaxID=624315 RepID=A0A6F8YA78_9ACTN|nr:hypothetical protein [Phytohabitans suffuscus]BCB83006.1 hypothetical protein Psuf_003190 [Phytohabitans suffuscus]
MSPAWILVVSGGGHHVPGLHEAVRSAAESLGAVRVEERDGRFVLVVPSGGVHPAAVAIRFPAVLAGRLVAAPDPVLLAIDHGTGPSRALRLAAALRGPAVEPPLTFALTEEAWRALSQGEDPVPLRDFRRFSIYDEDEVLEVWIRSPDIAGLPDPPADPGWSGPGGPAAPVDAEPGWSGPNEGVFGPPPGPDFPTDR